MKQDQDDAWQHADKGIKSDSAGHRVQALAHYKKAISVYTKAINRWSSVELNSRETRLLDKWMGNQSMCHDRRKYLETETSKSIPSPHNDPDVQFISKTVPTKKTTAISDDSSKNVRKSTNPMNSAYIPNASKPKINSSIPKNGITNPRYNRTRTISGSKTTAKLGTKPTSGTIPTLDYKGLDKKLAEKILNELVTLKKSNGDNFNSIAGNETAKKALQETIILPALRPEIFTGLRAPPKGILLFGPPGCGKTLLARALAAESKCTFFNISASALTSKWQGEGEKLVKTLFNLARQLAPTIIFIDEIDSFLTERKDNENEGSRRLKTEFMLQFDGLSTKFDEKLLVLGATNRPYDLDDAILRRFPKRIYIKLPDLAARSELLKISLKNQKTKINEKEWYFIVSNTENYSGSDLKQLAKEAAYEPIRSMSITTLKTVGVDDVPPITGAHFISAMKRIRPSVDTKSLSVFVDWNSKFGDVS
jgi:spastin